MTSAGGVRNARGVKCPAQRILSYSDTTKGGGGDQRRRSEVSRIEVALAAGIRTVQYHVD